MSEIDKNGDLFVVRECDDSGCGGLVIEWTRNRAGQPPKDDDEPDAIIDIPPELADWFQARVNHWANDIRRDVAEKRAEIALRDWDRQPPATPDGKE